MPVVDPVTDVAGLVERISSIGDVVALRCRLGDFPGVMVDRALRELQEQV